MLPVASCCVRWYSCKFFGLVGWDGKIARLESLEPVLVGQTDDAAVGDSKVGSTDGLAAGTSSAEQQPPDDRKRKLEEPLDWRVIQQELHALVGDSASSTVEFLREPALDSTRKYVLLPPCPDKDVRRELHQWIRSRLSPVARADTMVDAESEEKVIRLWRVEFERDMPNFDKFRRDPGQQQRPKPPKGKKYLRFVLYKENMDTGYAVNQLQRRFGRLKRLRIGYAGMKDKRGVTAQFVTVPAQIPTASLCSWNQDLNHGGGHTQSAGASVMRLGSFEYVDDELQLGRLQGNRFDIVLRNVQSTGTATDLKEVLECAGRAFQKSGCINYFGVQRFGKKYDTHLTGVAVLQGDYERAVDIILSPSSDERENIARAKKRWQERFQEQGVDRAQVESKCARNVVTELDRFMTSEIAVLNSLARYPLDYKRAFTCITKTMRMMFLHAVQSYIWNQVASHRIQVIGHSVVKGDLVYAREGGSEVKVVSDDDLAAFTYSIEDVVLPLVGAKTIYPDNSCALLFDELLQTHNLARDCFSQVQDRELALVGDYRKLICHPSDVDFEVLEYKGTKQPLLQTDLMKLQGINVDLRSGTSDSDQRLYALRVGFTLPTSSYATIALRELMKRPTSGDYQRTLDLGDAEIPENSTVE